MGKYKYYQVYSDIATMSRESKLIDKCPVQGVIDIVSKKWALLIVGVIGNYGRIRYNGIMQQLKGISPKTLADTLKELERSKIVNREAFKEIPPRVEYSLTQDGVQLRKTIIPLIEWSVARSTEKDCVILKVMVPKYRPEDIS